MYRGAIARLFGTRKTHHLPNVAKLVTRLILLMRLIVIQVSRKGKGKQAEHNVSRETSRFLDLEAHDSGGEDETSEEEGNGMSLQYYTRLCFLSNTNTF